MKRNFSGLFKKIAESVTKVEPTPSHPVVPLKPFKWTTAQQEDFSKGISVFGYPIIETFLDPSVVRLLVRLDSKRKYSHCLKSNFLLVLKAIEESADHPVDYNLNIADIINNPEIPCSSLSGARGILVNAKHRVREYLGLHTERNGLEFVFVKYDTVAQTKFYHDRNMIKAGMRAIDLIDVAHTRLLLGDKQSGLVPEDLVSIGKSGQEIYASRVLNRKDTRAHVPAQFSSRNLRHLL